MATDIVICITCERAAEMIAERDPAKWLMAAQAADRPAASTRGALLAEAVERLLPTGEAQVRVRRVDCLGRCLSPGNADLIARGRMRVEITALSEVDAAALVAAARTHAEVDDIHPEMLPPGIAARAQVRLPTRERSGRRAEKSGSGRLHLPKL